MYSCLAVDLKKVDLILMELTRLKFKTNLGQNFVAVVVEEREEHFDRTLFYPIRSMYFYRLRTTVYLQSNNFNL